MDGTEIPGVEELTPLGQWILDHGIRIALVVVIAVVGYRIFYLIAQRLARRIKALDRIDGSARDKRVETIFSVVTNTGLVVVTTAAALTILSELEVEVAPLLASVGIAGLALGLGAQTLVEDVISGIFIVVENQYKVGDLVQINSMTGVVEELNLRTTNMRALNGTLHIIPNGEIRTVSNMSSDWSRAIVDVGVTYETDVDLAIATLEEIGREMLADEQVSTLLVDEPLVTGVEGLDDWQIRLRMLAKTHPGQQFAVERYIRRRVKLIFPERGLSLASPRQEIVVVNTSQPNPLTENSGNGK